MMMITMAKIPIRFNRVAAAFDEVARAPTRLCESSGSEHSAEDDESPIDLSDLVASFMEREGVEAAYVEDDDTERENVGEIDESYNNCEDSETRQRLRGLFDESESYEGEKIRSEVEAAMETLEDIELACDFKRRVMSILRGKGYDAGLCKSRWAKTPRCPPGEYDYIDVKLQDGTRLIVEPLLSSSFDIARPTSHYSSLLSLLPRVFVGPPEDLKQVVRLMCTAMRRSMKSNELSVPPWRKNAYMQAKWFGSYKRTTNKVRSKERSGPEEEVKRAVGFKALGKIPYHCREDYGGGNLLRTGYLAAAFTGK